MPGSSSIKRMLADSVGTADKLTDCHRQNNPERRAEARGCVQHRAIARWTFPIWLYVSVTGVLVYVLLYQPTWLL